MTCGEVREILFAFLDNELGASLSIEVQRHIEHCPECAREAEMERMIQKRLAAAMEQDGLSLSALDEMARVAADKSAWRRRRFRVKPWTSLAVGVAAALLLVIAGLWQMGRSGPAPSTDGLVGLLVADFDHFVNEGRPVQIASADRGEVSRWLHGETGLAVSLPATKGHCKLLGARKCKLKGQTAALASYEMDAVPACLVVMPGSPDALASMERVDHNGRSFWIDAQEDRMVVACQREELIYAAISTADRNELLHFMSELE